MFSIVCCHIVKKSGSAFFWCSSDYDQNLLHCLLVKQMSLPPHLRKYVDPACYRGEEEVDTRGGDRNSRQTELLSAPKSEYDWRRPAVPNKSNATPSKAPQKPLKLARTLGTDGRQLHIQGNTVHHPTGRQMREYPLNGRESDNYLRRMKGADLAGTRPQKDTIVAQHLLPGQGIGVAGEWGDARELPGLGQEDAMRDALAINNPDTIADGLLPAIRPDIRKWTNRPVSYAAPVEQARERLIPDSLAGINYKANDFAALAYYSDALPQPAGSRARLESAAHLQLPLERRGAARRELIDAPIPAQEPPRRPVADEAPFEDVAHRVYGQRAAPTMLKAIKRVFKKLQRPHTLDYGVGLHDDAVDDRAIHGVPISIAAASSGERALASVRQHAREQPVVPLASLTGIGVELGDAASADHVDTSTATATLRNRPIDRRLQHRNSERYADDDAVQAAADAISVATTHDDRAVRAEQHSAQREQYGQQREAASCIDYAEEDGGGGGIADHVQTGSQQYYYEDGIRRRGQLGEQRLVAEQYGKREAIDEQLAGVADRVRVDHAVGADYQRKDGRLVARRYDDATAASLLDEQQHGSQMDYARFDERARAPTERRSVVDALQDANRRHSLLDADVEEAANRAAVGERARDAQNYQRRDASLQSVQQHVYGGPEYDSSILAAAQAVRAPRADARVQQEQYRGFATDEQLEGATGGTRIDLSRIEHDAGARVAGREIRARMGDRAHERAFDAGVESNGGGGGGGFADHVQLSSRSRAAPLHKDAQRAIQFDSQHGIVRGAGLDETLVGDQSFMNLQVRAHSAPPDPAHLIVRDQHRGIALGDAFGTSAVGDALAVSQLGTQQQKNRRDAMPNDAHLGGAYHAAHEEYEPSFQQQQVGGAFRPQKTKREANIHARVDNPDSDVLTNTVKVGVDVATNSDRTVARLQNRERGFLSAAEQATGRADEMHTAVMNEMLVAHEPVHTTMSGAFDGREGGLGLKLQGRLRTETPPPASHYANNSRFGKMINACPPASSAGQGAKRSDSPMYRRRSVVPQQ